MKSLAALLLAGALVPTLARGAEGPPLVEAVKNQDRENVEALLEGGADVNASEADGTTALHWAARLDDLQTVSLLINSGANVSASNRYGFTPIGLASINGNPEVVRALLIAGADATTTLPEGETALMTAARSGSADAVRALLDYGADPNAQESWRGQTALMWAAAEGHADVVQTLIERGADVHARSDGYFTPFLFAVREGRIDAARTLLDAGADVNETLLESRREGPPAAGTSALVLAAGNAHYELGALLLERGADPNASGQGWTALHQVTWTRRPGVGDNNPAPRGSGDLDSLEFVRRLILHGADPNARIVRSPFNPGFGVCGFRVFSCVLSDLNMVGATPFLMAARTADAELMQLLAELGADPLLGNEDNTTPLMVAAGVGTRNAREDPGSESEVLEAVRVALELGGNPNAVDNKGQTAMHGAASKQVPAVVPFLAAQGVDPAVYTQKNHNGWTALRIAVGVHRVNAFRSSPETAAALREVMIAAGVSTEVEPEGIISGETR